MSMHSQCKVDGCKRVVGRSGAHGMCAMHDARVRRHGDPHYDAKANARRAAVELIKTKTPPPGCAYIPLTRGKIALVDQEDFEHLSSMDWFAQSTHRGGIYAGCLIDGKLTLMHRLLTNPQKAKCVDHKNGDYLDNRKSNLRICTQAQNTLNHAGKRNRISKYKGVWLQKESGRWVASFKGRHLGVFEKEEQAAARYDAAARRDDPEFAYLNFGRK